MEHDVLFEELPGKGGQLGIITLNKPQVLNSINRSMVNVMHAQLEKWAVNPAIKAVVIRAVPGRAFCAGGDLRSVYPGCVARDPDVSLFFREEYQLNRGIFHFPKPYIALQDGITMGGGVGISIHGSHRVVTDNVMFAMPETGIGFFPDIGGSYFLPRLPQGIGLYLGLTGARIQSDECVALGLATHKVAVDALPALTQALAETEFGKDARVSVSDILNSFQQPIKSSYLMEEQPALQSCFSKGTMEEVFSALSSSFSKLCQEAATILSKKSPTSLKVTLRLLQGSSQLSFDACMQQDLRLATRFLQAHDFPEGIRAVIIDKDGSLKWNPATVEEVSQKAVEQYFAPLVEELAT